MNLLRDIRRINRNMNKVKNGYFNKVNYLNFYEKESIVENYILLESQHGTGVNGNIFYLLKELKNNHKYGIYEVFLTVTNDSEKKIKKLLLKNNIINVKLVRIHSKKYYKLMATAKYLINDNTFLPFFVKKEGQVYLNTWHGTPLKTLGKQIVGECHSIGNTQKNFVVADYLLYPNKYTMKHMMSDYMIENLSNATVALSGYPRNSAFFDKKNADRIRKEYHLVDKEVFAYMPTWRGTVAKKEDNEQIEEIQRYLKKLDDGLNENQIVYLNLHPIVAQSINLKKYDKIKNFPEEFETYEFLNICDGLITDYSSVMFDYAITRKKIILFTYDKEKYFEERGVYVSLDELPFPQASTVKELLKELNSEKEYDDEKFLEKYCSYEREDASEVILDLLLSEKKNLIETCEIKGNGKENILIYVGNLAKNGITSSIMSLLEHVDVEKKNYFITFSTKKVARYKEILQCLPKGIYYIPMMGIMNANIQDKKILKEYRKDKIDFESAIKRLECLYDYERKRCYGNTIFSDVIHFTGYEFKRQLLYSRFSESNRVIYVHSNMEEEIRTRKNQHSTTLRYAYSHYDKIAVVTKDMIEPTMKYCDDIEKIKVASNLFDYKTVVEKSKEMLQFDENTECNIEMEELEQVLESDSIKFITIGRFSPEKGHERLLTAFNRFWGNNKSSYLIIIGGHGGEYQNTIDYAEKLEARKNIVLIKSMTNPFTILKKCDCFVLSSFYEGLGLVILEADALGIPVFSTNIPGPSGFIQKNNGNLVDDSEQGLYDGMVAFSEGELNVMNVDYDRYNHEAVNEFKNLLR